MHPKWLFGISEPSTVPGLNCCEKIPWALASEKVRQQADLIVTTPGDVQILSHAEVDQLEGKSWVLKYRKVTP